MKARSRTSRRQRGEEVGSMMIYKKQEFLILSCDPRACLATGAMGKPQTPKRVPIMKHENQPPPFLFIFFPCLLPSSLTLPPLPRGVVLPGFSRFIQVSLRTGYSVRNGRGEEVGSMMIYKNSQDQFYHATRVPTWRPALWENLRPEKECQ